MAQQQPQPGRKRRRRKRIRWTDCGDSCPVCVKAYPGRPWQRAVPRSVRERRALQEAS